MSTSLARARELARVGRFKEAFAGIPADISETSSHEVQVFKAEMLERTGQIKPARVLADRLLRACQ